MQRCVNACLRRNLPAFWMGFSASVAAAIIGWISGAWPIGLAFGAAGIFIGLGGLGMMLGCYFECRNQ